MLRLLPVVLLCTAPAAGFSWPAVREQLMRCDLDAGTWVVRVGECTVTCTPDDFEAVLPDGGWCQSGEKIRVVPVRAGDFWAPGEWPYARH